MTMNRRVVPPSSIEDLVHGPTGGAGPEPTRVCVALATPVYDQVEFDAWGSRETLLMMWERFAPARWHLRPESGRGQPVHHVRNALVEECLTDRGAHEIRLGCGAAADVIVWQDSDCAVPDWRHYLLVVRTLLEGPADVGMVGAPVLLQAARGRPTVNVFMAGLGDGPALLQAGEPFECAAIGFGLVAVKRAVFDAVAWPWFKWRDPEQRGVQPVGEDVGFCDDARKAGFRVMCEPRAIVRHNFRRSHSLEGANNDLWFQLSGSTPR